MLSKIVTLVSPLQSENAYDPILVTLRGIVTFSSPLHPENAYDPMFVTLDGIVMLVSPSQPYNALYPILVTRLSPSQKGIFNAPVGKGETAVE